jgi:hypothetical protein
MKCNIRQRKLIVGMLDELEAKVKGKKPVDGDLKRMLGEADVVALRANLTRVDGVTSNGNGS